MAKKTTGPIKSTRPAIIQTVQTPLGFFVLVVLVVEVIFGGVASITSGIEREYVVGAMMAMILILVGIVTFLAYARPEALAGIRVERGATTVTELTTAPKPRSLRRWKR